MPLTLKVAIFNYAKARRKNASDVLCVASALRAAMAPAVSRPLQHILDSVSEIENFLEWVN
jgi:hypothetical protein